MATAREILTDRIIEALGKGIVPWKRPWDATSNAPANYVTERNYSGMNVLLCLCAEYTNPFFLTFNQIKQLGGTLKKGSKSIPLCFYKAIDNDEKDDEAKDKKFILRYFNVFRWEDTEGIPEKRREAPTRTVEPIQAADAIWNNYQDRPELCKGGDRASYSPSRDLIRIPVPEAFHSIERYYTTLFHEMVHSTGASKRLNRDEIRDPKFGTIAYSREELVAEIGSSFLSAEAGISSDSAMDASVAYIHSWIKFLKDDPQAIFAAASKASKAADHILGRNAAAEVEETGRAAA